LRLAVSEFVASLAGIRLRVDRDDGFVIES